MPRTTTSSAMLGPEFTPPLIRWLLMATAYVSLFCALFDGLIQYLFGISGFTPLLILSWSGLQSLFLWQPFTYLFLYGAGSPITLWWLIGLAFKLYLLWFMGSYLYERFGARSFLTLYLMSGAAAGICATLIAAAIGMPSFLSGPTAPLLAILMAWTMANSTSTLLLFFIIPIQAHILVSLLFGALLLIALSNGDFASLLFYASSGAIGYLYGIMVWELNGPYPQLRDFDDHAWELGQKIARLTFWRKEKRILTINPRDEQFMDAMLDKISRHGKGSLSFWERWRMQRISKKRR